MLTVNEKLIVTKQVNEVMCRYANKILIRKFLFDFTFPEGTTSEINPTLQTLSYYQGDYDPDTELEALNYIHNFIEGMDDNDLTALYYLTINENIFKYCDDFENNEGYFIKNEEIFDKKLGRDLAYKIYEPEASGLKEDLVEMLKNKISNFSGEFDLSEIDDDTIEHILETIEMKVTDSVFTIY